MDPLIHIGYHKTGTTWLQRHLWINGSMGLARLDKKELHKYFVIPRPFDFDFEAARKHFEPIIRDNRSRGLLSVASSERLSGNPHSGGYDSKEIAYRLHAAFPEGRIVLAIREQSAVVLAAYKQYVRVGGPGSLTQYLVPPGVWPGRIPFFDFQHFAYHSLIEHYYSLFGKERVLVLVYEQFLEDPQNYVRRILDFAQIAVNEESLERLPFRERENISASGVHISLKRRLNYFFVRDSVNTLAPMPLEGGNTMVLNACSVVERLIPAKVSEIIDSSRKKRVRELIGDRYKESNAITSELIGCDLAKYGYRM
ncbi:MAG TPA: sulfotransferase [Candidatus Obscuribacterales bacterium]